MDCGLSCTIIRLGNIYGPESPENTVVGRILRQIQEKQEVQVHSLSPVRDFIHVDDVVTGIIRLLRLTDGSGCRVVNLSTGIGTSIAELVRTALIVAGRAPQNPVPHLEPTEDVLVLSNERLEALTGWKPTRTLMEGLRESIR